MMKKINNRQQLHIEKLQLELQNEKLKHSIHSNWQSLKQDLSVANLAKEGVNNFYHKSEKLQKKTIFNNLLLYGVELLTRQLRKKRENVDEK